MDDLGIVTASDSLSFPTYQKWLQLGCQSSMSWLEKYLDARKHPSGVLSDAKTLIIGVLSLKTLAKEGSVSSKINILNSKSEEEPVFGRISPYAICTDYHLVLRQKMSGIQTFLQNKYPELHSRIVVDTAPLPEKEWACRAGLGWIGRHTLLVHPQFGCSIFLGTLLVSLEFERFGVLPEQNIPIPDQCRQCNFCQKACPVSALREDRTLDGRLCLNYWTIENRTDPVPDFIKEKLGDRLFGCDECLRVCPRNRYNTSIPSFFLDLNILNKITEEEFNECFHSTALKRIGLKRLYENSRTVLKNRHNI